MAVAMKTNEFLIGELAEKASAFVKLRRDNAALYWPQGPVTPGHGQSRPVTASHAILGKKRLFIFSAAGPNDCRKPGGRPQGLSGSHQGYSSLFKVIQAFSAPPRGIGRWHCHTDKCTLHKDCLFSANFPFKVLQSSSTHFKGF
jgi:hypothetical protein